MTPGPAWLSPPVELKLFPHQVHIWRAALNLPTEQIVPLAQTLGRIELERAADFWCDARRRRFVVARGALKAILGRYLRLDPGQIEFFYGASGKPFLKQMPGEPAICFSVTHTGDTALFAISQRRKVGIDLEHLGRKAALEQLAPRCFTQRERAVLSALPTATQQRAFLAGWTRKEAYLKARGDGLTVALDSFEVSLRPGEPPQLLNVNGDPAEASRWTLREIHTVADHVATLAAEGQHWDLAGWDWNPGEATPIAPAQTALWLDSHAPYNGTRHMSSDPA